MLPDMENLPTFELVTHDGSFHADDVLCHALLDEIVVGYDIVLVRTRDPAFTTPADNRIVFDVGGLYDPDRLIFDHHQKDKPLREDGSPYSAFGLLWKHAGIEYLEALDLDLDDLLPRIWKDVDEGFVREIDGYDTGTAVGQPQVGHVSSLVEDLVPRRRTARPEDFDREFKLASQTVGFLFRSHVYRLAGAWRDVVRFQEMADLATLPGVAILPEGMSWKKAVFSLGLDDLLYAIYPKEDGSVWYCSCVPPEPGSFAQRLSLPEAWSGLRDDEFAAVTGVQDAVFCHPARFICGAGSREGVIELARQALQGQTG
jgi:uncharacterized UPF0160 family protein